MVRLEPDAAGVLPLRRGELYSVHVSLAAARHQSEGLLRIKDVLGGLGEGRIRELSLNFYRRVYADHEDPGFRALFAMNSTLEEAVANQADFLVEMFGVTAHNSQRIGEDGSPRRMTATPYSATPYSNRYGEGQLVPRTIGKHHPQLMNGRFARRWLAHMLAAVCEVFAGDARAARSVARYFNHFLAFFEFPPPERLEICRLCCSAPFPVEEGPGGKARL